MICIKEFLYCVLPSAFGKVPRSSCHPDGHHPDGHHPDGHHPDGPQPSSRWAHRNPHPTWYPHGPDFDTASVYEWVERAKPQCGEIHAHTRKLRTARQPAQLTLTCTTAAAAPAQWLNTQMNRIGLRPASKYLTRYVWIHTAIGAWPMHAHATATATHPFHRPAPHSKTQCAATGFGIVIRWSSIKTATL